MLTAALLERQIVVFCPSTGPLAACVLSLLPLLRPFAWQSLLMPVTPASMIGFIEAPVPFVLGVQYKTGDVAAKAAHCVRVNVYKRQVKNLGGLPHLPNCHTLRAAIAPHYERLAAAGPDATSRGITSITEEERRCADALLYFVHHHLSTMCGNLLQHTITNVGLNKRTGFLMRDSLLDAAPHRDRPFLRAFMETQMFSVHSDAVISDYCEQQLAM